jgi:hypothetical protein
LLQNPFQKEKNSCNNYRVKSTTELFLDVSTPKTNDITNDFLNNTAA